MHSTGSFFITLPHYNFYIYISLAGFIRNDMSFYSLAIYSHRCDTLLYILRILYGDMIVHITKFSGELEVTESFRNTRIDAQTVMCRVLKSQNCICR